MSDNINREDDPPVKARAETGNMRFGEDWTGVFIRGDHAFHACHMIHSIVDDVEAGRPVNPIALFQLRNLGRMFARCDERQSRPDRPTAQLAQLVDTPGPQPTETPITKEVPDARS